MKVHCPHCTGGTYHDHKACEGVDLDESVIDELHEEIVRLRKIVRNLEHRELHRALVR